MVQRQKKSSVRRYFAIAFFIAEIIAYMDRSSISFITPQMIEDLHTTKQQFGLLALFFSPGYALIQVPSDMLTEKFGPRRIISIALLRWNAFTVLTGMIKYHGLLYLACFLFDIGEVPMYPFDAVFNSAWFAKDEKGRTSSALLTGSYFGPVLAPVITIAIVNAFNWQTVFYIFRIVGIMITTLWAIIAKGLPEQHHVVNDAEKQYIMQHRDLVETTKSVAPRNQFSKRMSFYTIAGQYFIVQSVIALFLIWLPTYLAGQYHVRFKDMTINTLPWFIMFILILSAGVISGKILHSGRGRFIAGGLITTVGFIVFAISIFSTVHTESLYVTIFRLSPGLGSMGISMRMNWATTNDVGRSFAGTVSGWMNLWRNIGALISPFLAGVLVSSLGWIMTFQLLIIPTVIVAVLWFFVTPDKPLIKDESRHIK